MRSAGKRATPRTDRRLRDAPALDEMFAPAQFLSLEHTAHPKLFEDQNYVWNGVVMGNSCEFKNSIIFDEAQVPHFNYVGDSILGFKAHLGAGVILSNVKLDHSEIAVAAETPIATGLTKFGAIVGDRTGIGCNAVINPGSVLGRDCLLYPNVNFRGVLPEGSVVKLRQEFQILERRDHKR